MCTYKIVVKNETETEKVANALAIRLASGDVITLEGDLGAGKTTFTKGIARGLNIKRTVTSPTFTILKQYNGDIPLNHIDAYRLEFAEEDIGFDDYFYGEAITVIEWAQFISEYLPESRLDIEIKYLDETSRRVIFHPKGDRFQQIVKEILESYE